MTEILPPVLVLLVGAILISLTRGQLRSAIVLISPLVTLWAVWQIPDGVAITVDFIGYQLEPVEGSALRYAASAIGVAFAGDLITLFIFWEAMAIFSTAVVWCGGTPRSGSAGRRYAIMHVVGGVILMVGIAGVSIQTGSIDVQAMRAVDFVSWMILIGLLINAAAPPVSAWLSDAYPEATSTGAVFLSAFTTKTAVLALILLFPGEPVLIGVGIYMIFYGIIYALLENDARRILAYSIVNQVGFMVCAIGIGTGLCSIEPGNESVRISADCSVPCR